MESRAGRSEGVASRPVRVVLLVPETEQRARALDLLARHAAARGYAVDSLVGNIFDALQAVEAGVADRVLVVHGRELMPLIEVVGTVAPVPIGCEDVPGLETGAPSQRRPRPMR